MPHETAPVGESALPQQSAVPSENAVPFGTTAPLEATVPLQPAVPPQPGVIRDSVLPHGPGSPRVPGAPAITVPDAPAEMTIVCPECGAPSTVALARRDADDFCPICDYPLFWARPQDRKGGGEDGADDARWRSPGASGASLIATVPCPVCRELNVPSAVVCVRCGADMNPPPPPEPEPVPAPEPAPVPQEIREPDPAEPFPWWWFATVIAMVGVAWYVSIRY
ncbi:hypothetical protein [Cellulomonas sp. P24]|uniref:hypothetical protein n=1 Tax=Cellulomonas sp. P24 TaxID=2885206 RepID=UPI00216ADD50|nr:hypothetical protein [Cellulomonas sp. P24]MCR6493032.1 hypothetical protein [Cellulomonas sp. P24]